MINQSKRSQYIIIISIDLYGKLIVASATAGQHFRKKIDRAKNLQPQWKVTNKRSKQGVTSVQPKKFEAVLFTSDK